MSDLVQEFAAAIKANTNDWCEDRVIWEEFDARQRALWDAIPPALVRMVAEAVCPMQYR